MTETTGGRI